MVDRPGVRDHQILMAEASLPEDPSSVMPVSFKVAHELRAAESDPKLRDKVRELRIALGRSKLVGDLEGYRHHRRRISGREASAMRIW